MKKSVLKALLTLAMLTAAASAEVVGFNISGGWGNPSLEGLTFDGCSDWTDGVANNGNDLVLNGTDGMVTVSWSSNNLWWAGWEDEVVDKAYRIYLDDGGNGVNVQINGIADWLDSLGLPGCTVRIYQNSDGGYGEFQDIQIIADNGVIEVAKANDVWNHEGGGERGHCDVESLLYSNSIELDFNARADGEPRSTMGALKITTVSPYFAYQPLPGQMKEVPIANQTLTWSQAEAANEQGVTYNVYFGDPNSASPDYYGNNLVKTTSDDPADFFVDLDTLENSTEYAWRVDAIVPNDGEYTGFVWTFTTQPEIARIEAGPDSQVVEAGEDVELTVEAINTTTYQWYKDGVALADDTTDTMYTGENTDTLTILDVQLDDEGAYYCVADNSLLDPFQSDEALLLTKRMMGWWKFDNDLTDSVKEVVAGAPAFDGVADDPNLVEGGIDGGAIEFFGDIESVVSVPGTEDYYNFYPYGYTVSVWVKNTMVNGWGCYVSKSVRAVEPWEGIFMCQSSGNAVHGLRKASNDDDIFSGVNVDDGQWHLVTGTFDAVNKEIKVYVDGLLRNEVISTSVPPKNSSVLMFGAEDYMAEVDLDPEVFSNPYTGMIDDVRIWNYAIDSVEAANLYVNFVPDAKICIDYPTMDITGPEGERDCIVNIYDFTAVAEQWLNCNIVPDCLQ